MDINDIAEQAAAKIDAARDAKVNAVKTVAASGVKLTEAVEELTAAEQQYAKDHAAAQRAGWSETDLRGFGITAPTKKAGGRPRGTKKTNHASANEHAVSEAEIDPTGRGDD
ncbi:hypothetical protein [Pseudarthrobacter sp. PS3-L1]|uniref:hypothetical protein n=1 Tax=Pseudarthrobacter sp. PS3-L1 TaxID=3046207 RepID=UPI0024B89644|nr:hypothetical protein [Pseudarthrobacter sp. PS3-L1]MDJ0322098.1 hypothetical protein [Pseudarthrobacter sp. PS3-L1]